MTQILQKCSPIYIMLDIIPELWDELIFTKNMVFYMWHI